jgi:hypothetical protein
VEKSKRNGRGWPEVAAELSHKQQRALAALLTARTVQDAAGDVGIGERTLRRWLDDPRFRAAYAEASRRRLSETVCQLRAASAEAVNTLRAALNDDHTGHRIRAAIALLDTAVKVEVDDLARRVELLEAVQQRNGTVGTFK